MSATYARAETTSTAGLREAPAAPGGRGRAAARWVGRGALALAILGAWLEVVPRYLFGIAPLTKESIVWQYDPVLGWCHAPGKTGMFVKVDLKQPIAINSLGLREREIGHARRPGEYRILVLGNSVTVGFEVPQEKVYPRVMERELARLGCRATVINGACRGWGSDQSLLFLRREGLKYRPDLVIYGIGGIEQPTNMELHRPFREFGKGCFRLGPGDRLELSHVPVPRYPTDVAVFLDERGEVITRPCSPSQARWLWFRDAVVTRSAACTLALQVVMASPWLSGGVAARGSYMPDAAGRGFDDVRESYSYRVTAATYRAMKAAAEAAGASFVLSAPSSIDRGMSEADRSFFREVGQEPWDLGREAGPWLSPGVALRLRHDAHFNEAGHEAVGKAMARGLVALGLVPTGPGEGGGDGPISAGQ